MSQPIEAVMAQLRQEIETRMQALTALERLVAPPAPVIDALPAPPQRAPAAKPRAARAHKQIDLEEAIAATKPAAEKPARNAQIDPQQLRELHGRGLTDGQIARELGRSQPGTSAALRRLGLAPNKVAKDAPPPSSAPGVERVNSAATIVSWLRQRGTIIADAEPGKTWKVNGRDIIDRAGLLTMANRKREIAKQPPFAFENG